MHEIEEEKRHSELFEINITEAEETKNIEPKKIEKPSRSLCHFGKIIKILSMPTLLFIAVILGYIGVIPLKMEYHSVIIIGIIYTIFLFFIKHNACYSICGFEYKKLSLLEDVSKYIEDHLIKLMGKDKAIGSVDKYFNSFSKKLRNDNFAAIAAATFPTLGILGTFISIAISMPDFGVGSTDALNSEITKLLGGVGTAFYASIYGIFLALWWTFFEKKGFTYIQKEIREAKEMFAERLWSDEELKRAGFIEQQSLNTELQSTIKQSLSPEFITKMNDTIGMQTSLLVELLQEDKALHEELRETYKTVVEKFSEITDKQNSVSEKLDQSIETANQSYTNLSENVGKLEELSETFKLTYDAFSTQNESSKDIAQTLAEVSTSLSTETKTIVGSLEGVTSNLSSSQDMMGSMTDKLLTMTTGISTLFEGLTETTDKQNIVSDKLDKSIHMANQSYSNLSDNVGKLEALSHVFQSNYDAIATQTESSKEIADILVNVIGSLSSETKEIIQSFNDVSSNLTQTQTTMGTMSDKLMGMSTGMQNILDGLNDTYKNTIEKQMESIKITVGSLETLYSKFHDNIDNTLQSFEVSAANIKSGGDQMVDSIRALNLQTIGDSISLMSKSLHALEGSMQTTSSNLDESVSKFDEQFIEKLRYTFKVLDEEIGKVLSKVGTATKTLVDTSGNIEENLEDFNSELLEKMELVLSVVPQEKEDK